MPGPQHKLVKVKDLGVVAFPFSMPDDKIVAAIQTHRGQIHATSARSTGITTEESEHARLLHYARPVTPHWNTLRQAVYKATEPTLENPNTTPTADTWDANKAAAWNAAVNAANVGGNILKRAGRFMFGLVDMVPQVIGIVKNLYSPDEKISQQAETDLLNLHPGAQIADRLKEAVQEWRKSKSLASENLVGDLLGFYLAGKVGGKAIPAERARLQQMGVVLPPEMPPEPLGLPAPEPPTIEGTLTKPAPLPAPAGLRLVEITANLQRTPVNLAELRKEATVRRPQAAPATPVSGPAKVYRNFEQYAAERGASSLGYGEAALHRSNSGVSARAWKAALDATAKKDAGLTARRDALRQEYQRQIASGAIREMNEGERLRETAAGSEESEAAQAARRVLAKRQASTQAQGLQVNQPSIPNPTAAPVEMPAIPAEGPALTVAKRPVIPAKLTTDVESTPAEAMEPAPATMNLKYTGAGESQPFYLKSEKILGEKMKGPMPGEDLVRMLENSGVKAEELKWTGLDELRGKERVTPEEVRQHLAANNLQIEEVMKGEVSLPKLEIKPSVEEPGGWDVVSPNGQVRFTGTHIGEARQYIHEEEQMWSGAPLEGGPAKYGTWVTPGAKPSTYRELLLTLPEKAAPPIDWKKSTVQDGRWEATVNGRKFSITREDNGKWYVDEDGGPLGQTVGSLDQAYKAVEWASSSGEPKEKFRTPHWPEANVVGHIRYNDRTGPNGERLLHLEEIQSDWHQKGRTQGYAKNLTQEDAVRLGYSVYRAKSNLGTDAYFVDGPDLPRGVIPSAGANTEAQAWADLLPRLQKTESSVPDAPFKKTWPELLLKRMIRYAAENGYDGISWTPGEQQAERYDLSKQVDNITYFKNKGVDTYNVIAYGTNQSRILQRDGITTAELGDLVGKDAAKKITENAGHNPNNDRWYAHDVYDFAGTLEGENLKVGGEGMKDFYDQIVPEAANKIGKPWGAKVGETQINVTEPTKYPFDVRGPDGQVVDVLPTLVAAQLQARSMGPEFTAVPSKIKMGSVPYLPITAEMRAGVMAQPFALFKLEYRAAGALPSEIAGAWKELDDLQDELNKIPPPGAGGGLGQRAWRSLAEPEAKLNWKRQHQEWLKKAQPLLDRYWAAAERLEYLNNKNLGEVRSLPGGEKILYLNRNGLNALRAGFVESISPEYTLMGASLNAEQIGKITENLRSNGNPFHKEIAELLTAAQDAQGNVTVAAIPEKGQSLRESLYLLREELNHTWQKAFADASGGHLTNNEFKELNASMPQAMKNYLRQYGYIADLGTEISNRHRVLEATAKLLSEAPERFGLSEDEAAAYLFEYFDAVQKQHGAEALNQLKHITRLARAIKEDYSHAREGAGASPAGGAEGRGAVPGLQGEGPAGHQGGVAPAQPGAPAGAGTTTGAAVKEEQPSAVTHPSDEDLSPGTPASSQPAVLPGEAASKAPAATGVQIRGIRGDADKVMSIMEGAKKRNPIAVGSNLPAAPKPIRSLGEIRRESARRNPSNQIRMVP